MRNVADRQGRHECPRYLPVLVLALLACSSGEGESQSVGGAPVGDSSVRDASSDQTALTYRPCSASRRVGAFLVRPDAESRSTEVSGRVRDGVLPSDVWEEVAAQDDCHVMIGPQLFCEPPCGSEQTCASDGDCIAYPVSRNVGSVAIDGLAVDVLMAPSSANYYQPLGITLPYPPYVEGDVIRLEASGGEYDPFVLQGQGVAELVIAPDEIVIAGGEPVALSWTPASEPGTARIHVALEIAQHGGVAATLECDVGDSGALQIAPSLVADLVDRGVAGFPTITVTRRTVDSVAVAPGCVEFVVASQVVREVTIPGVLSCSAERPCPDGRMCQADLTCS